MEMNIMFMDQKTQNCYNVISPQIDVYYSVQFQSLSPQAFLQKLQAYGLLTQAELMRLVVSDSLLWNIT